MTLKELIAAQESGELRICPRCGENMMLGRLTANALSRHAQDVYVCSPCGMIEAMLDMKGKADPVEKWFVKVSDHNDDE